MKIKTIEYSGSHEMVMQDGLKRWKKLGMTAEITEGDDEKMCAFELANKVESLLTPSMLRPNLGKEEPSYQTFPPIFPQPLQSIDRKAQERLEKLMDDCQTLDELMMHQAMAKELGVIGSYNYKRDSFKIKSTD